MPVPANLLTRLDFAVRKYDRSAILRDGPKAADPACRSGACLLDLICIAVAHPLAAIDREGVVELPCGSEGTPEAAGNIVQGCQSSAVHGRD